MILTDFPDFMRSLGKCRKQNSNELYHLRHFFQGRGAICLMDKK